MTGHDTRGYYKKFTVVREDTGEEVVEDTFTLIPAHDDWAIPALLAYADACEAEAPQLAADLRQLAAGA
jgi:hypothetical protein